MLAKIITGIFGLLFMGALAYWWLMPVFATRKGRQVDARVRFCAKKELQSSQVLGTNVYYEVTVELYGLNGEMLVRSLQSDKPYMPGDVICCRYLDKKGILLSEEENRIQTRDKYKLLLLLVFFIVFLMMLLSALRG